MGGIINQIKGTLSEKPSVIWFIFVFSIVQLHLLRNLISVPYLLTYSLTALVLVLLSFKKIYTERSFWLVAPLIVFIGCAIWGFLASTQFISVTSALFGLSRFTFALPILLALYLWVNNLSDLQIVLFTFLFYFAVVAITLPLQMFTGPIAWFSSSSTRAGLVRFTSLAGSMTTFGIVVGCYLLLMPALQRWWGFLLGGIIILSSAFSLSKAAVVNVVLAVVILFWFYRKSIKSYLLWLGISVGGLLLLTKIPAPELKLESQKAANGVASNNGTELGDRISASLESFNVGSTPSNNGDVSVFQGAIDRIFALPALNFEAWLHLGPWAWLTGGGFGMAGAALVPQKDSLGMMAHNQFAEIYSVFGVIVGTVLLSLLIVIFIKLLKIARTSDTVLFKVIFMSYLLLMVNAVFANGVLYQPAGAAIFYLSMFTAFAGKSISRKSESLEKLN